MKKILFVFSIFALSAAGCNSVKDATTQPPVQTPVAQTATPTPTTVQTTPMPTPSSGATVYTNTDYGFTLTFPATWAGYKVKKEQKANNAGAYYKFYIPNSSNEMNEGGYYMAFVIDAVDPSTAGYIKGQVPTENYLGSGKTMDFYVRKADDMPNYMLGKIDANVVIKTFKIK